MADLVQSLFRIDPTQGLVDYVHAVKPYHTKLLEVLVEYVYTERVDVTVVGERWKWNMSFARPDSEVVYTCGYGHQWDPYGITAPESTPTSLIVNATGKLFVDVTTATGSSNITIIRNISGHVLAVNDPVVFDFDDIPPPELIPGTTYYVTSATPTQLEVGDIPDTDVVLTNDQMVALGSPSIGSTVTFDADTQLLGVENYPDAITIGHTYNVINTTSSTYGPQHQPITILTVRAESIVFTGNNVLRIAPRGLPYNTFLVQPSLNTSAYAALVTSTASGQLAFVDGYDLTGVNADANVWSITPWTPGSGYISGGSATVSNVLLIGGTDIPLPITVPPTTPTETRCTVTFVSGAVTDVTITSVSNTKRYVSGDILTFDPIAFPTGSGFTFVAPNSTLSVPAQPGDVIYINGNTSPIANGRYTVASVSDWDVFVNEDIPPLTNATGTMYTVDKFNQIPYWSSGSKVKVSTTGTLPTPLSSSATYYFIPSDVIGVFNLATKRYPESWDDYIDITSVGTELQIERAEPFVPGDYVIVSGSYMHHNDGRYIVTTIEPEGTNFRISVGQSIKSTTPTPAPANDGVMRVDLGTYDMPLHCPAVKTPDLYAGAYIHENLQFTFSITERDFIGTTAVENEVGGWGTDLFGSPISLYGSGSEKFPPYTAMTDGASTSSATHTIIPTGFDTQYFDLGPMNEDLNSVWTGSRLVWNALSGQYVYEYLGLDDQWHPIV